MEQPVLAKNTVAFGLALAAASVADAILVAAKESSPAIMAGMQKLTGHHWITHSALVLGVFALVGLGLRLARGGQGIRMGPGALIGSLVAGVAAGGLGIMGFYLLGG